MSEMQQREYAYVPEFTLGDRLRRARRFVGFSQEELAAVLGIHQRSMSNYENDITLLDYPRLVKWAEECQVDLAWLAYGRSDVPPPTGRDWSTGRRRATGAVTIRYPLMSRLGGVADNAAIAAA